MSRPGSAASRPPSPTRSGWSHLRSLLAAAILSAALTVGCHSSGERDRTASTSPEVARLVAEAGQRRAAGDVPGARTALEEALRLSPDNPKALEALGRMQLLDFSDPDGALASYQRAVAVAPNDADAHYGLGQQLHYQGDMEAARAEFREALRLRPGWSRASAWLGTTELEALSADVPAAIRHLEAAAAADGHYAFARYELGRAYGRAGRWTDAAASLRQAVALNPGYREAHYALGQALQHLGQEEAARRELVRFHALDVARREQRTRNVRRRAGALDPG
jgi:tetratricopeptide (TPR) repeat protein